MSETEKIEKKLINRKVLIAGFIIGMVLIASYLLVSLVFFGQPIEEEQPQESKIEVYQIGETITLTTVNKYKVIFAGIYYDSDCAYLILGIESYKSAYNAYIKIYENSIIQIYKNQQFKVLEFGNSWITLEDRQG